MSGVITSILDKLTNGGNEFQKLHFRNLKLNQHLKGYSHNRTEGGVLINNDILLD